MNKKTIFNVCITLCACFCAAAPYAGAAGGQCAQAAGLTSQGWSRYRSGDTAGAGKDFAKALSLCPGDNDAELGLGFAALRQSSDAEAAAHFKAVAGRAPGYADAYYGLALCAERSGDREEALADIKKALQLAPGRDDFKEAASRLEPPSMPQLPEAARPAGLQMYSRVSRERGFEVLGRNGWEPLFIKGINLGAAQPGKYPSQFPPREVYARWLEEISEAGFNLIRVYTIHPPYFYELLREHNLRSAKPIYLIHGVWTEPPPDDDFSDKAWFGAWTEEMDRVVDLLHGRANIPERPGHSSGIYRADVSRWVLAYILGREWEPDNVVAFNGRRPGVSDFNGRFVKCRGGHATEVFMAEAMEHLLAYENDVYFMQHPMAYTNWPTLDPLSHPTETTKAEEAAIRKRLGLPVEKGQKINEYDNDAVGLDMEKIRDGAEFKAGFFASYHAYPYYPDFMNLDPGYSKGRDYMGPNNYYAYLRDLVRHHSGHAVLISEFGVPSSRLVAHWQAQGMTHGGQNEKEQGEQDVRLFRDIHDSGCAGGVLFAWINEWFKKNWLVISFEEPLDRKPFWYNSEDAEENYGLIGYLPGDHGPSITIDGGSGDWKDVPVYQQGPGFRLKLLADEGWLHVGIYWDRGAFDPARDSLLLGVDTFDKKLGDHTFPFGLPLRSEAGMEFALLFRGGKAAVYADEPYDLFTHRYNRPYRTIDNDSGIFLMQRTESNRLRFGRDGTQFPEHRQEIGWLKKGTQDRSAPGFDSGAEWQAGENFMEARIPWGLLNVTDPSSRRVVQDPPGRVSDEVGTAVTEGFRVSMVAFRDAGKNGVEVLRAIPAPEGGTVPAPPLFSWKTWEQPFYHEYRKQSFDIVKEGLRDLPGSPARPE